MLIGSRGNDVISGGNGDDVLIGGGGQDVLDGGPGNNILLNAATPAPQAAVLSQFMKPLSCANEGTRAQSMGMKTNGQLAAIQPIVPHTRTGPKSCCGSLRFANAIELVIEMVGT